MIRIAITGPESCGKTTLANALSEYYNIQAVPEYSRFYLEEFGAEYNQQDLDIIALGHYENIILSQNSINIVDSDFVVLKIWSEYKYGNTSKRIAEYVKSNHFDLHILCSPDIPWEPDKLRENPHDREKLFELYLANLRDYKKNFIVVNGSHSERFEKSVKNISSLLN